MPHSQRWRRLVLACLLLLLGVSAALSLRWWQQAVRDHQLLVAIQHNDAPAVLALLRQGADPNARDRKPSRTLWEYLNSLWHPGKPTTELDALHLAIWPWRREDGPYWRSAGNPVIVEALVTHGAALNARDSRGFTPLMAAIADGKNPCAWLLLAHGAEVNGQDKDSGITNLMRAVTYENLPLVQALLARGVDPNVQDKNGLTALMCACFAPRPEIVRALVSHHADVNLRDHSGKTALSFAGDPVSIRLLQQAGAR